MLRLPTGRDFVLDCTVHLTAEQYQQFKTILNCSARTTAKQRKEANPNDAGTWYQLDNAELQKLQEIIRRTPPEKFTFSNLKDPSQTSPPNRRFAQELHDYNQQQTDSNKKIGYNRLIAWIKELGLQPACYKRSKFGKPTGSKYDLREVHEFKSPVTAALKMLGMNEEDAQKFEGEAYGSNTQDFVYIKLQVDLDDPNGVDVASIHRDSDAKHANKNVLTPQERSDLDRTAKSSDQNMEEADAAGMAETTDKAARRAAYERRKAKR